MTEQKGQSAQHAELLDDLKRMLREQLEFKPADLRLRVRLATLLVELGRRDAFVQEAQIIFKLLKHEPQHPVLKQIQALAEKVSADPKLYTNDTEKDPQRRLGEDPAAKAYFEKLDARLQDIGDMGSLLAAHDRNLIATSIAPHPCCMPNATPSTTEAPRSRSNAKT
jgi:hypothetical protein